MKQARILFLLAVIAPAFAQQQQFGEIGNQRLVSGEIVQECRVGYRIFGQLNANTSNIIVYPTWARRY